MTTRQKQALLAYLGLYDGPLDGIWGQQSQRATEDFQWVYMEPEDVDGDFGPKTEKRILEVISTGEKPKESVQIDPGNTSYASAYLHSDGYYHIPRGVDVQLSRNLWAHEIHCRGIGCCTKSIISKRMVDTFQAIRDDYGAPIEITTAHGSGYRCQIHNSEVGGAAASLHMTGDALDLHARDKERLLTVVDKHVTDGEIGVYGWGIHVGVWDRGFVNRFIK